MRVVKLIKSVEWSEIPVYDGQEYMRLASTYSPPQYVEFDGEIEDMQYHTRSVPITRFCKKGAPDVYLAMDKAVEELIKFPYSVMAEANNNMGWENLRLRDEIGAERRRSIKALERNNETIRKVLTAPLFTRIRYLLTGRMPLQENAND